MNQRHPRSNRSWLRRGTIKPEEISFHPREIEFSGGVVRSVDRVRGACPRNYFLPSII